MFEPRERDLESRAIHDLRLCIPYGRLARVEHLRAFCRIFRRAGVARRRRIRQAGNLVLN